MRLISITTRSPLCSSRERRALPATTKDKGATAPAPGGDSPGGGKSENPTDSRDKPSDTSATGNKTWEVGVAAEYHHLVYDGPLGGYTNNATSNNVVYYSASARAGIRRPTIGSRCATGSTRRSSSTKATRPSARTTSSSRTPAASPSPAA